MSAAAAGAVYSAAMPSGALGDKVKTGLIILVVVVVIVVIYMVIKSGSNFMQGIADFWNGIGEGLGIKDSAEDKKADADLSGIDSAANSSASPFNPTFYKSAPAGTRLKTQAVLSDLADQIYDSVGVVYDDPEAALGAFKQCSNWCMVSQLSDKFNQLYGKDAYSWMRIKFDTTKQKDILAKLANYCFSLPKYS
jgi:hypothetical protein